MRCNRENVLDDQATEPESGGVPTISLGEVRDRVRSRSAEICDALDRLGDSLETPSALPEWSRLTLACHLRYGAQTTRRMIEATLDGRQSAFYPAGRDAQRESTLRPALGEAPLRVLTSLRDACVELDDVLAGVAEAEWSLHVEPSTDGDLGAIALSDLLTLRLTEVEVHGTDLNLGLEPWADVFGRAALEQRLARARFEAIVGAVPIAVESVAPDVGTWVVRIDADGKASVSPTGPAEATVTATANDHVAMLLGRTPATAPDVAGDREAAAVYRGRIVGP